MKYLMALVVTIFMVAPATAQDQDARKLRRMIEQLQDLERIVAEETGQPPVAREPASVPLTQPAPPRQPPQPTRVVLPFEDLNVHDELPDYVYSMPRQVYIKWCKMQNKGAYREAQRMADDFSIRHPLIDTYVQDSDYTATVEQEQHEKVTPNSADLTGRQATKYQGQNKQFTYRDKRWGGGPVVLLNPYAARPAKVIFQRGIAFIADPDGQLKSQEEADALMEAAYR